MKNVATWFYALLLLACGGAGSNVDSGPMPHGGSFEGVWFSPQYGRMDLREEGSNIVGIFEMDERTGHIQGVARGRVMRFQWTEEREMISGLPRKTTGRGYFVYIVDNDGEHKLQGEWGHDNDDTGGGPWNAVKSRSLRPRQSLTATEEPKPTSGGEAPSADKDAGSTEKSTPVSAAKPKKVQSPKAADKPAKDVPSSRDYENTDDLSDL
ncbi:MAG: hypothetical protein H6715_06300 [Myxococcales bacterium]|nr:hypothetical protein [Myxococcales bacterium]MCB9709186.1 hypothetical protein [Myxococcales bacterium]